MTLRPLTEHHLESLSLKRGYTGSSESTLVKISHCWKAHVAAHINLRLMVPFFSNTAIMKGCNSKILARESLRERESVITETERNK